MKCFVAPKMRLAATVSCVAVMFAVPQEVGAQLFGGGPQTQAKSSSSGGGDLILGLNKESKPISPEGSGLDAGYDADSSWQGSRSEGSSGDAGEFIEDLGKILEGASEASRSYRPQPRNYRRQPRYRNYQRQPRARSVRPRRSVPRQVEPSPAAPPENVEAPQNNVPEQQAEVAQNKGFKTFGLTQPQIEAEKERANEHIDEELGDLRERLAGGMPPEEEKVTQTLEDKGATDEQIEAAREALEEGDADRLEEIFEEATGDRKNAEALAEKVRLENALEEVERSARKGHLTQDQLDRLERLADESGMPPAAYEKLRQDLRSLGRWDDFRDQLEKARPGRGGPGMPAGRRTIVRHPDLRPGSVVDMGNGAVMVGDPAVKSPLTDEGTVADAVGLPTPEADPAPVAKHKRMREGALLMLPDDVGTSISYLVNDHKFTMEPAMTQRLGKGDWTIRFNRGGDRGEAEYSLGDGTYVFKPTDNGWELYQESFKVIIDNSKNPYDFRYVVNNEKERVRGGGRQTHQSDYPLVVRFDSGNGSEEARRVLKESGPYYVGIDPQDNRWDLFETDQSLDAYTDDDLFEGDSRTAGASNGAPFVGR